MPRLELVEVETDVTLTPHAPQEQQSLNEKNPRNQQCETYNQLQIRSDDDEKRKPSSTPPPTNGKTDLDKYDVTQAAVVRDGRDEEDDESIHEDDGGILFSCRCESSRPVITLLSCLRNVSISNTSGVTTSGGNGIGRVPTSSDVTTSADSRRGKGKVQYASVFVSDKSIVFQVHGVGRQSRATVEMQAGLFSEFYVSEQLVPILDDEGDDELEHEIPDNDSNSIPDEQKEKKKSQIIKGGEFGVNLTTVLECLGVLGSSSLDRTTLCLSYHTHSAIFKIELLEDVYANAATGAALGGPTEGGVVISNCAIPGMSVAEEQDTHDGDECQGLDHAFRLHPIIARARIKSEFLKDAINELADVTGAISATIILSRRGLELSSFGHSTECLVVLPYMGNHPEIFISLEGTGNEKTSHGKTYPIHSLLSSMRGLEIASETCISINANGIIAIQHQVLDLVGRGQPNYVDFIMGCLEDDDEEDVGVEKAVDEGIIDRNGAPINERDEEDDEPEPVLYEQTDLKTAKQSNSDRDRDSGTEINEKNAPTSLFGTVGDIGPPTNKSFRRRRKARRNDSQATNLDSDERSSKRPSLTMEAEQENMLPSPSMTKDSSGDEELFEEDVPSMDATATVSIPYSNRRRRMGRTSDGAAPSSPQLMYGDTRLEASEDF